MNSALLMMAGRPSGWAESSVGRGCDCRKDHCFRPSKGRGCDRRKDHCFRPRMGRGCDRWKDHCFMPSMGRGCDRRKDHEIFLVKMLRLVGW